MAGTKSGKFEITKFAEKINSSQICYLKVQTASLVPIMMHVTQSNNSHVQLLQRLDIINLENLVTRLMPKKITC
jgi:hypothetical protein